jgi:hypothetical protein
MLLAIPADSARYRIAFVRNTLIFLVAGSDPTLAWRRAKGAETAPRGEIIDFPDRRAAESSGAHDETTRADGTIRGDTG